MKTSAILAGMIIPDAVTPALQMQLGGHPDLTRRDVSKVRHLLLPFMDCGEPGYMTEVGVGTPPQRILMSINTEASMLGVPMIDAICDGSTCIHPGVFVPSLSSTNKFLQAQGCRTLLNENADCESDVLTLDGRSIPNVTLAQNLYTETEGSSDLPPAAMGLGFPFNNPRTHWPEHRPWLTKTLLQHLKQEKIINRLAYSLSLNDLSSGTGSILFGGIDLQKLTGDFIAAPMSKRLPERNEVSVLLSEFGIGRVTKNGVVDTSPLEKELGTIHALLNPGVGYSYLPPTLLSILAEELGHITKKDVGPYDVPCSLRDGNAVVTIRFGGHDGPLVHFPFSQLISEVVSESEKGATTTCKLMVLPSQDDGFALLGSNFLRSIYMTVDLENHVVAITNTKFDSSRSDIRDILTGRDLPGVIRRPTKKNGSERRSPNLGQLLQAAVAIAVAALWL